MGGGAGMLRGGRAAIGICRVATAGLGRCILDCGARGWALGGAGVAAGTVASWVGRLAANGSRCDPEDGGGGGGGIWLCKLAAGVLPPIATTGMCAGSRGTAEKPGPFGLRELSGLLIWAGELSCPGGCSTCAACFPWQAFNSSRLVHPIVNHQSFCIAVPSPSAQSFSQLVRGCFESPDLCSFGN
jgi:hypothetical protein